MKQPSQPTTEPQDNLACEHNRPLLDLIRHEGKIRGGLLPFDRFMELALYAPGLGYYVTGTRKLGRGGDFTRAPKLGSITSLSW